MREKDRGKEGGREREILRKQEMEEYNSLKFICALSLEEKRKLISVRVFPLACGTVGFSDLECYEQYLPC